MVSCESGDSSGESSNASYNSTDSEYHFEIPALYVALAFGAALLSTLIALFNILKHLKNYTRPEFQKSLIRILFIVPVYAVFSWLSLAIPTKSLIFESIRDVWEAVVIYEFLKLILAYCGGESACLLVIMKSPGSVEHMWPFNYCFRPLRLDARFMRICKRFTLQFVIIKPIMAAVNIGMLEACLYTNKYYQMSQLIVYNISYSFSLYGLVLFYLATHHHPGLLSRKPLLKFLAIKTIIFATYYQGLLVQLVPGFDRHYLESLNNFIFCWEMIVFAIVHVWAFGWFEFVGGGSQGGGIGDPEDLTMPAGVMSLALQHDDLMEMQQQQKPQGASKDIHGNVKDAFNMGDVVGDALENFDTKYEQHVRLDTSANTGIVIDEEDEHDAHNPFQQLSSARVEPSIEPSPSSSSQHQQSNQTQSNQPSSHQSGSSSNNQANPFKNPFEDHDMSLV